MVAAAAADSVEELRRDRPSQRRRELDLFNRGRVGGLAAIANFPDQALGDDRDHRRRDQKALDAHVDEPQQGSDGIRRVQ